MVGGGRTGEEEVHVEGDDRGRRIQDLLLIIEFKCLLVQLVSKGVLL